MIEIGAEGEEEVGRVASEPASQTDRAGFGCNISPYLLRAETEEEEIVQFNVQVTV